MTSIDQEARRQLDELRSISEELIPESELEDKLRAALREARPLRVKYGIDPTNPNIHIGHLVPCRVLRAFQKLGHVAVLIIGDYTARVGDPTGRNAERPPLSQAQVEENLTHYASQLFRVVDERKAEVHRQSEWFGAMSLSRVLEVLARFSVAQMLAHETFRVRMAQEERLSLHELMYPAMQAYDSLQIDADVEIGGSDQKFNCLCGRDLQRASGARAQVVVTVPLLAGTDGRKMSKSFGNHIALNLSAAEMIGKVMSIADEFLEQYVLLATDWSAGEKRRVLDALAREEVHPMELKLRIAENVAAQFHGPGEGRSAAEEFERVFQKRERPQNIASVVISRERLEIIDLLLACGLAGSRSDARRLVDQGGVRIDDRMVTSAREEIVFEPGIRRILNVGRRRYVEARFEAGPA